ncbi:MAG: pyridoxal 5'-phosphate synthase glutaminase subunit PdxT [Ilumatobacteraceae bacterium]
MPNGVGEAQPDSRRPVVGVLALQGAFDVHRARLHALCVEAPAIRTPDQLETVDALVLPGGESTTMSRLLDTSGLFDTMKGALADGLPVFGTCAGMILCATELLDGRPDQRSFDRIDLTVRRNGYGRQLQSFETELEVAGLDEPFHAVFIRAPLVERIGPDVEVLAEHDGVPVLVRDGSCTVASFHPELTEDTRLHALFLTLLDN